MTTRTPNPGFAQPSGGIGGGAIGPTLIVLLLGVLALGLPSAVSREEARERDSLGTLLRVSLRSELFVVLTEVNIYRLWLRIENPGHEQLELEFNRWDDCSSDGVVLDYRDAEGVWRKSPSGFSNSDRKVCTWRCEHRAILNPDSSLVYQGIFGLPPDCELVRVQARIARVGEPPIWVERELRPGPRVSHRTR